ncbi:hypothetical protein BLNAU_1849 [Blattamonas nauphoetae]|uniref:Uncharacterized protein n=1 Tax=Blattamonas nauphoetae TaxID=2049346 RepID=A0ABQ9YHU7_9EUKA|nr:hypothetical protein BLNAU_1849 [Blattamonas nauphoetae]
MADNPKPQDVFKLPDSMKLDPNASLNIGSSSTFSLPGRSFDDNLSMNSMAYMTNFFPVGSGSTTTDFDSISFSFLKRDGPDNNSISAPIPTLFDVNSLSNMSMFPSTFSTLDQRSFSSYYAPSLQGQPHTITNADLPASPPPSPPHSTSPPRERRGNVIPFTEQNRPSPQSKPLGNGTASFSMPFSPYVPFTLNKSTALPGSAQQPLFMSNFSSGDKPAMPMTTLQLPKQPHTFPPMVPFPSAPFPHPPPLPHTILNRQHSQSPHTPRIEDENVEDKDSPSPTSRRFPSAHTIPVLAPPSFTIPTKAAKKIPKTGSDLLDIRFLFLSDSTPYLPREGKLHVQYGRVSIILQLLCPPEDDIWAEKSRCKPFRLIISNPTIKEVKVFRAGSESERRKTDWVKGGRKKGRKKPQNPTLLEDDDDTLRSSTPAFQSHMSPTSLTETLFASPCPPSLNAYDVLIRTNSVPPIQLGHPVPNRNWTWENVPTITGVQSHSFGHTYFVRIEEKKGKLEKALMNLKARMDNNDYKIDLSELELEAV